MSQDDSYSVARSYIGSDADIGELVDDAHTRNIVRNMTQDLERKTPEVERMSVEMAKLELRSQAEIPRSVSLASFIQLMGDGCNPCLRGN
jgi:hypothetical protein